MTDRGARLKSSCLLERRRGDQVDPDARGRRSTDWSRAARAYTALYEFGPFYLGYVTTPAQVLEHCRIV